MPNITISLDDDLIKESRDYAKKHNTSLNNLIRVLLKKTVSSSGSNWLDECFRLMDQANINSDGLKWSREDLYRG